MIVLRNSLIECSPIHIYVYIFHLTTFVPLAIINNSQSIGPISVLLSIKEDRYKFNIKAFTVSALYYDGLLWGF